MARSISVAILGDSKSLERAFTRSEKSAKSFAGTMEGTTRHVARSVATMAGGFAAFAGVEQFLKSSVDAARDAGVAQAQLAAQMKASGQSFAASRGAIEKAGTSLEKFGFTSEDSAHALTVLERGTGNITKAIGLQALAANLARAKNLDLASAANVVAKVFGGQETALRRAVPGLDKNAHGVDLIREASARLAGQAKAGTTDVMRFHAALHDTEVIIGTALLPTLNKLLVVVSDWLTKMNRSGQLQKDVNEAVRTGTEVFKGVFAVVKPLAQAFKTLGDAVGGTKNEVELLAGAFLVFKSAKLVNTLGGVGTAVAGIGANAERSAGKVGNLNTKLGLMARNPALWIIGLGAADFALGRKALTTKAVAGDVRGVRGSPFVKGTEQNDLFQAGLAGKSGVLKVAGGGTVDLSSLNKEGRAAYFAGLMVRLNKQFGAVGKRLGTTGRATGPAIPGSVRGTGIAKGPLTAAQSFKLAFAARPDDLGLLREQAAHDRAAIAFAGKLRARGTISNKKYVDEVSGYASDLRDTNDRITGILKDAADTAKAAVQKRAAAGKAATAAAKAAREAQLATRMGWLEFGVERAEATKKTRDDLKAYKAVEAFLKARIRQEGRTLDLVRQLWETRQKIRDLNKKKSADVDPLAGLMQVSSRQLAGILAAGTGLGVAGRRRLGANIAGAEIQPIHVHNTIELDGAVVARSVNVHNARSEHRTARQTSGYRG